jgi:hypothetical protein
MTELRQLPRETVEQPETERPAWMPPEVPDWDQQVEQAEEACLLIDRHLDFEARGRVLSAAGDFRPQHLCPEQRVQMVTDLHAVTARR